MSRSMFVCIDFIRLLYVENILCILNAGFYIQRGIIMKKILGLSLVLLLLAAAVVGFVVWKGNQPLITYYESGQMKTFTQRHFFKENGEYKKYNEDGTLSQQYTLLNGRKIGIAHIYGDNFVLEASYLNGKLFGPIKIDTHQADADLESIKINVGEDMAFSAYLDSEDDLRIEGKIKCEDETFFSNIQTALKQKNAASVREALGCLSWNKMVLNDDDFKCTYEGDYQYPSFNENSRFTCKGFEKLVDMKNSYLETYADVDSSKSEKSGKSEEYTVSADYSVADKALNISVTNADASYRQVQTYKGFESVTEALLNFGFSAQKSKDIVKLAVDVLKNLTISESSAVAEGKKIADVKGDFNFMNGFSNPWAASFYDGEGSVSSQLKISDKGVMINTRYPISKTPMFAISLQISNSFKDNYQKLLNGVISEFETKEPELAMQNVSQMWPQYAMGFADVIQSVNMILSNNKGEKVLAGVVSVKKGADLTTLMMTPEVALDIKIITYQDSKVNKVITGNMKDGFVVDGRKIEAEQLREYLNTEALNQVMKDIEEEFSVAFKDAEQKLKEGKSVSDPFMIGFYSGYTKAMSKYKLNKVLDEVSLIIANTKVLFSGQESYEKLNADLAKRFQIIPEEMISSDSDKVITALGGEADIYASGKDAEGDNKAFIVEVKGLPDEACVSLVTEYWQNSNFVAMGINEPIDDRYIGSCKPQDNVVCANGEPMNAFAAFESCQNSDNNTVYWKFF